MPKISIIIITKNDEGVGVTLMALSRIKYPSSLEIIVVDASEPAGALAKIRERYPNVRWIQFNAKSNKFTFPEQRNMGLSVARGEYVIFIDCDCVPDKNWLIELYKILESGVPIVSSQILSARRTSLYGLTTEGADLVEIYDAPANGLGMRKSLFNLIGKFDERFTYGEDTDICWLAKLKGLKIICNNKAIIMHDFGSFSNDMKRSFRYGAARAKLYRKHSYLMNQLFHHDINALAYSIFLIFLPVAFFFPAYLLILLIPLIKNINNHPFLIVIGNIIYGAGFIVGSIKPGYAV